jgi:hypothetical protein
MGTWGTCVGEVVPQTEITFFIERVYLQFAFNYFSQKSYK